MDIKGNYLHILLRRTTKNIPYHPNISPVLYPIQNQNMINRIVNVTVKDNYRVTPDPEIPYQEKSDPQIITLPCRVIRFDDEEPYRAVYASLNYEYIIADSSKDPSERPLINTLQYDKNNMDIIGQIVTLQSGYILNYNLLKTFDFPGVVASASASNPYNDIIIGQYTDDIFMVYMGDEVWCKFEGENILETDTFMAPIVRTMEIRRLLLEGKVPYGISQDTISEQSE